MKAISSVIAAILLLMITIALASTAYMFTSGMLTGKIAKTIDILSFSGNLAVVQNTGTSTISIDDDLKIIVNGQEVEKLTTGSIAPHSSVAVKFLPPQFGQKLSAATVQVVSPSNAVTFQTDIVPHAQKVTADTVAMWHFDEGAGQKVYDETANNNDGRLGSTENPETNDPVWENADCKFGKCLKFDGVNDNDEVTINLATTIASTSITACAWFKRNSGGTVGQSIVGTQGYELHFYTWQDGTFQWGAWTTYTNEETKSALSHDLTQWTHACVVIDGRTLRELYVNGERDESIPLVGDFNGATMFRIGYRESGGHIWFFNGMIDEVIILDKALSQGEIIDSIYG